VRESGELENAEVVVYLNRLADLLWLFALIPKPGVANFKMLWEDISLAEGSKCQVSALFPGQSFL